MEHIKEKRSIVVTNLKSQLSFIIHEFKIKSMKKQHTVRVALKNL